MRMRFWATILRPAFSITALMAPVRLRLVASGLMIEKVRSVAMDRLGHGGSCGGLYRRGATATRHSRHRMALPSPRGRAKSALMLHVNGLTYRIGARVLFENASVALPPGARVGFL